MPEFISDNTALSNFASIGRVDLLDKLCAGHAFTTIEVLEELNRGVEKGYRFLEPLAKSVEGPGGWLKVLVSESLEEGLLRQQLDEFLHPGEASCIVFAQSRAMVLVTDDLAARALAAQLGIALTGPVGLLVESIRAGLLALEDGNALLTNMIDSSYRSPCAHLDELL